MEFEDLVNAKNALAIAEEKLEENKQNKLVKEFVDADDIAEVVARWTFMITRYRNYRSR